ncbi:MAG: hypothetical protein R2729_09355 [Bryobacteraceae bacterium]
MQKAIRKKIEAALSGVDLSAKPKPESTSTVANVQYVVDRTIQETKTWTLKQIADKHQLDYSTVYRQLIGKPGCFRFGKAIRVSDSLYRSWLEQAAIEGIRLTA